MLKIFPDFEGKFPGFSTVASGNPAWQHHLNSNPYWKDNFRLTPQINIMKMFKK